MGDAANTGAFMNYRMTASSDAIQACDHEDVILWLQPRSALEYPSDHAGARDTFRHVTASLGLGALLTFGTAVAGLSPALAHSAKSHPFAAPKNAKAATQKPLKWAALKPTKVTPRKAAKGSRAKLVQIAAPKPPQRPTPKPVPGAADGQPALEGLSRQPTMAFSVPGDIAVPPVAAADLPLIVVEEAAAALAGLSTAVPAADLPLIVVEEAAAALAVPSTVPAAVSDAPSVHEIATGTVAQVAALETPSSTAVPDAQANQGFAATPETASVEAANTGDTPQMAATPAAHAQAEPELAEQRPGYDPRELLQFDDMRVPRWIVETILKASDVTGVDPVYMMALADKESSFIPANRAGTSSAEGLFQFISSTWLEVVRSFGAKHGLVTEAAAIERSSGQLSIPDEAMREHVLGLRRDPYLSALMAAEMMKRDRAKVELRLGRSITRSEFYLAHFFGVDSASKFMALLDGKPKQSAPRVFPRAAKANRTLFFAKKGRKTRQLSVSEVYSRIDGMIDKRLDRYQGVMTAVSDASL